MPHKRWVLRVPLPLKVFLSYLLVVAAGAIPLYAYVHASLQKQLLTEAALALGQRASRLADDLVGLELPKRLTRLKQLAPISLERMTYLDAGDRVLFDSVRYDLKAIPSQAERPEVRWARAKALTPSAAPASAPTDAAVDFFDPQIHSVAFAQRVSDTTFHDTLYAAVLLPSPAATAAAAAAAAAVKSKAADSSAANDPNTGRQAHVLRLSVSVARFSEVSTALVAFFRNTQAVSVSIALFLSLLAAVVFMRPLQQVGRAAKRLASGDLTVDLPKLANDEVGDVGRALERLAAELRRRMARAESGEAVLSQLVEVMPLPLMLYAPNGLPLAINGRARAMLGLNSAAGQEQMQQLLLSEAFVAAQQQAEEMAEPVPISAPRLAGTESASSRARIKGYVHVLKRPELAPYIAFFNLPDGTLHAPSVLPDPKKVTGRTVSRIFGDALRRIEGKLEGEAPTLEPQDSDLADTKVAEVHQHLSLALSLVLERTAPRVRELRLEANGTRVGCVAQGALDEDHEALVRLLVGPLGGSIEQSNAEVTLWLPRA